jgi:hypothetical protein
MGLSLIIAGAGAGGATEVYTHGLYQRTTLGTPIALFSETLGNVAALRYSSFRLLGAAAGYQVPAGKTLIVTRVLFLSDAAAVNFCLGYSDSDRGFANAADGANPVNLDAAAGSVNSVLLPITAALLYDIPVLYQFPAAKFPRLAMQAIVTTLRIQLYGHEV